MAYSESTVRYEFDLRVRKFRVEVKDPYPRSTTAVDPENQETMIEDLSFKSLSALEVMRKLIDYLRSV